MILFDNVKTFTIDYGTFDGVSYKLKAISGKQGGILFGPYLSECTFESFICELSKSELIPFTVPLDGAQLSQFCSGSF